MGGDHDRNGMSRCKGRCRRWEGEKGFHQRDRERSNLRYHDGGNADSSFRGSTPSRARAALAELEYEPRRAGASRAGAGREAGHHDSSSHVGIVGRLNGLNSGYLYLTDSWNQGGHHILSHRHATHVFLPRPIHFHRSHYNSVRHHTVQKEKTSAFPEHVRRRRGLPHALRRRSQQYRSHRLPHFGGQPQLHRKGSVAPFYPAIRCLRSRLP